MQYDIFISYSRKDSHQVNSLIDQLRREIPGIRIWYDIDGIETAGAFRTKIIGALDESQLVIFACSDNSLASEYCEKEIMYAKNIGKTVIPYLLPGMKLKGWLLFEFGNINCVSSSKEDEVARMIRDIKLWTNHNTPSVQNDKVAESQSNTIEAKLEFDPQKGEFKEKTQPVDEVAPDSKTGYINGHEYVDLGLPSGLKWATCNLGAGVPEEYGDYFAWGEIKTKSAYDEGNSETSGKDNQWLQWNRYIGDNDNLTLWHDVAHQKWGGTWRLPTLSEIKELIDNTITEWTTLNGVEGQLVKSKKNGHSIFLPANGYRSGSSLYCEESSAHYWCSTPDESDSQMAYYLLFGSSCFNWRRYLKSAGFSVRPVSD